MDYLEAREPDMANTKVMLATLISLAHRLAKVEAVQEGMVNGKPGGPIEASAKADFEEAGKRE